MIIGSTAIAGENTTAIDDEAWAEIIKEPKSKLITFIFTRYDAVLGCQFINKKLTTIYELEMCLKERNIPYDKRSNIKISEKSYEVSKKLLMQEYTAMMRGLVHSQGRHYLDPIDFKYDLALSREE